MPLHKDATLLTQLRDFEHGLQHAERLEPSFCPVCALAVPAMLPDESPTLVALQSDSHGLWDACMRSLTAPRTRDQKAELRRRLQEKIDTCEHGDHNAQLARWEFEHIVDPLNLLRALLCLCLTSCLYGLDPSSGKFESTVVSRARDPRKRFRSPTGAWPTVPNQLLPHGPTQTLGSLVDGCLSDDDNGCWWILTAVLLLARPLVWPVLIADRSIHVKLCFACMQVISHGTTMRGKIAAGAGHVAAHRDRTWLSSGRGRTIVAAFLHTVREGPYARPDDMYHFVAPCIDWFRQAHALAMWQAASAGSDSAWETIMLCLTSASAHVHKARLLVSDDALMARVQRDPRGFVIINVVQLALIALYSEKSCAGPACTRTTIDEDIEMPSLPTCARCKLARYCSRGCQRGDWANGHKRICRTLAALESVTPAMTNQREYAIKIQHSAISNDQLALVAQWALSSSQHYRDIIRTDMA